MKPTEKPIDPLAIAWEMKFFGCSDEDYKIAKYKAKCLAKRQKAAAEQAEQKPA